MKSSTRVRPKRDDEDESVEELAGKLNSKIRDKQESDTKSWVQRVLHDPELDKFLSEFRDSLKIDKHDLDGEWEVHPEQYQEVADAHAIASSRLEAAKRHLDIIEAEVNAAIRDELSRSDGKVTEREIQARVTVNTRVVKANEELLRLSHSVKRLQALKESWGERRYALRDLVQLYVATYYSDSGSSVNTDKLKGARADYARKEMNRMRRGRE